MATKTWTITDAATNRHLDQLLITPDEVGGAAKGYSVVKRTLRGGLSDGVEAIRIDNGAFAFELLPTRGMSVWKAWLGDGEIGWRSPICGPVHPNFVPLAEPSGLGWLDGFDELLVRCGLESNGAPEFDREGRLKYPLHGRIANKPARKVEVTVDGDTGEITVVGVVEEARLLFQKLRLTATITTKAGESGLQIRDEVENFSSVEAEMQMLYHINFGPPILDAGARFSAPVKSVVPRDERAAADIGAWSSYAAAQAGFQEQVYFLELLAGPDGRTQTLLRNARATRGVSIIFNKAELPCYTLWKHTASMADGYVTGLEPGTNYPNPRSYEVGQGRVVKLPPGGKRSFDLRLEAHDSAAAVESAEQAIGLLQGAAEPHVYERPQEGWRPGA